MRLTLPSRTSPAPSEGVPGPRSELSSPPAEPDPVEPPPAGVGRWARAGVPLRRGGGLLRAGGLLRQGSGLLSVGGLLRRGSGPLRVGGLLRRAAGRRRRGWTLAGILAVSAAVVALAVASGRDTDAGRPEAGPGAGTGNAEAGSAQAGGRRPDGGTEGAAESRNDPGSKAGAAADRAAADKAARARSAADQAAAARAAADKAAAQRMTAAQAADARAAEERAARTRDAGRQLTMPALVGLKLTDALDVAASTGLTGVSVCRTPDGDVPLWLPRWQVARQGVPAGTRVLAGQSICLYATRR